MWWIVLIPTPILIWIMISPRGFWNTTAAWQYKNPDAHEPSEASHTVGRVVAGLAIGVTRT